MQDDQSHPSPASTAPPKPARWKRRLFLTVILMLPLIAAGVAWLLVPQPVPVTYTLIQLPTDPRPQPPLGDPGIDLVNLQRTQMALVRSRQILRLTLDDMKVANLPLIRNMSEPVEWLEKQVQVDFSVAPVIMRISMSGLNPEDAEPIVTALRTAYLTEAVDRGRSLRRQRLDFLGAQITKFEDQLKAARDVQAEVNRNLGQGEFRGRMLAFSGSPPLLQNEPSRRATGKVRKPRGESS